MLSNIEVDCCWQEFLYVNIYFLVLVTHESFSHEGIVWVVGDFLPLPNMLKEYVCTGVVTEVNKAYWLQELLCILKAQVFLMWQWKVGVFYIYAVNVNPSLSWISKHMRSDSWQNVPSCEYCFKKTFQIHSVPILDTRFWLGRNLTYITCLWYKAERCSDSQPLSTQAPCTSLPVHP